MISDCDKCLGEYKREGSDGVRGLKMNSGNRGPRREGYI